MEVVLKSPPASFTASLENMFNVSEVRYIYFLSESHYSNRIECDLLDDGAFCERRVASLHSGIRTQIVQLQPVTNYKV
jgi:hypothetical protein